MAGGVIISEHQKRRDSLKAAKENAPSANINLSTIDELSETYVKNFDIEEIISLQNKDSIQNKRSTLLEVLFGNAPIKQNVDLYKNISLADYPDLSIYKDITNLIRQTDMYQVNMEQGVLSKVIHFHPNTPNNKIVFFHKGHGSDYIARLPFVKAMLTDGYDVVEFSMPLKGINDQNDLIAYSKGVGPLRIKSHSDFRQLYLDQGLPLKFFIAPVLNVLELMPKDKPVYMVGISGGGWTTLLSAALAPQIEKSVSIAGAWPAYMKSHLMRDNGDYEQVTRDFYRHVNYPELMLMGATGKNRSQLLIYNQYDPCCFAGSYSNLFISGLKKKLSSFNNDGSIDLYIDSSQEQHTISGNQIKIIREFLN